MWGDFLVLLSFKNIKTFIFDLDGTVWRWNVLIPGVRDVIKKLQSKGRNVFFVSNNAILSRAGLARKLSDFGLPTEPKQIISAAYVVARYFVEKGIDKVYVIGERGIVEELDAVGIGVSEDARHVVATTDRNFSYWKIKRAMDLAQKGAQFYCTGHGKFWPVGEDIYPGEEPIVKAVEAMTGKPCMLLGKPSDVFKQRLLTDVSLFPEDTLFVGDELKNDIVFGNKCGFKTAIVLTGNTTVEEARAAKGIEKPDTILTDLRELVSSISN